MKHLYIGVDGGATKCLVRVEDEAGKLIGEQIRGPANIRISVLQATESIYSALTAILQPLAISLQDKHIHFHAGMGLAGCEVTEAYQAFLSHSHPFTSLVVSSDAHTACLGAHLGKNGAIIIAGTGAIGFQMEGEHRIKVGGWGFPQDDQGGGAWLGLEAAKLSLQCLDGRVPMTALAKEIYAHFDNDQDRFVGWVSQANSTAFAELAPIVIRQSKANDRDAKTLLQRAAREIERISSALLAQQQDPSPLGCALVGGIAPFLKPYLSETLSARLQVCLAPPVVGALFLVRKRKGNG